MALPLPYFDIGVISELGEHFQHYLAMHQNQVLGEPVTCVEPEVWMKFLHLPVVRKQW